MSRNRAIEGLRGLAALVVLGYHLYAVAARRGLLAPRAPVEKVGLFAVATFFLISGYLIARSLLAAPAPLRFLRQRALRLYPAFVPLHLAVFAVGPQVGYAWMG